jgi:hypothetical protein
MVRLALRREVVRHLPGAYAIGERQATSDKRQATSDKRRACHVTTFRRSSQR